MPTMISSPIMIHPNTNPTIPTPTITMIMEVVDEEAAVEEATEVVMVKEEVVVAVATEVDMVAVVEVVVVEVVDGVAAKVIDTNETHQWTIPTLTNRR